MIPISSWYQSLGQFSFPTQFVALTPLERKALTMGEIETEPAKSAVTRLQRCMKDMPGSCFVSANVCAPTDSQHFGKTGKASYALNAWRILAESPKVVTAFEQELTTRLTVRPYRRMNRTREFRMFFYNRELKAMSQYHLERHFHRLEGQEKTLWRWGQKFGQDIKPFLPTDNSVIDVYISSEGRFFIIDLNSWGSPTLPLLLRDWDRDWDTVSGLKLRPKPVKMKGEVSVSF
ncbi:MAG: hypothetical protein R6V56_02425 [Lentisphaeria bacterium]